jgi:hypothetical protein
MLIETRVQGIPCIAEVLYYKPARYYLSGPPEHCYDEGAEFEFRLRDRRGRLAPWLDRKLTEEDTYQVQADFLQAVKDER